METLDLKKMTLRELNRILQSKQAMKRSLEWEIKNPDGSHALGVGITEPINVIIRGSTGYYCGGMNKNANITIEGSVGPGVCENIMSGSVTVEGNASQYAGATGNGGTLTIRGNASSRCGISMKGVNIVVEGNIGHMAAFMAQSGNLVVLGDAGETLGDSIYEARIFVRGKVKSLGADCIEKEMKPEHIKSLKKLLEFSKSYVQANEFRRYGSARKLYHFKQNNTRGY